MGGTSDLKCLCRVFRGTPMMAQAYVYLLWPYAFAGN